MPMIIHENHIAKIADMFKRSFYGEFAKEVQDGMIKTFLQILHEISENQMGTIELRVLMTLAILALQRRSTYVRISLPDLAKIAYGRGDRQRVTKALNTLVSRELIRFSDSGYKLAWMQKYILSMEISLIMAKEEGELDEAEEKEASAIGINATDEEIIEAIGTGEVTEGSGTEEDK